MNFQFGSSPVAKLRWALSLLDPVSVAERPRPQGSTLRSNPRISLVGWNSRCAISTTYKGTRGRTLVGAAAGLFFLRRVFAGFTVRVCFGDGRGHLRDDPFRYASTLCASRTRKSSTSSNVSRPRQVFRELPSIVTSLCHYLMCRFRVRSRSHPAPGRARELSLLL
jgi:hypothetical protein